MPRRSEFVDHVVETLRVFGPVEVKRMFGGWGLYHRDVFFALVESETLYLKTDDENRAAFDAQGLEPFSFTKGGETVVTSYRQAPVDALESPEVMADWARRGYAAALRARGAKKRAKPPK